MSKVTGQASKSPALVHKLLKKRDLVDFILHESELMDKSVVTTLNKFRSPLSIMLHFSKTLGLDLVKAFLNQGSEVSGGDSAPGEQPIAKGFDELFALSVASFRDEQSNLLCKLCLDILWDTWSGSYDDEIERLATQDMTCGKPLLWHKYCSETKSELGVKYRAVLAAAAAGPISVQPLAQGASLNVGASELSEKEKAECNEVHSMLMSMRRKTVNFVSLPSVGAASGADYTMTQLQKVWEQMRLGHRYSHAKENTRAFVFSADMFPPNLAKPPASGGTIVEQVVPDAERTKRVIDFIVQKRARDDIVLLFDGRSRACRKVIEQAEESLAASGAHQIAECWYVFVAPPEGERRARATSATQLPQQQHGSCLVRLAQKRRHRSLGDEVGGPCGLQQMWREFHFRNHVHGSPHEAIV